MLHANQQRHGAAVPVGSKLAVLLSPHRCSLGMPYQPWAAAHLSRAWLQFSGVKVDNSMWDLIWQAGAQRATLPPAAATGAAARGTAASRQHVLALE